jgi:hypothetical protein
MIRRLLVLAGVLVASPALAQSTYVAGAISADLVRVSHAEGEVYQGGSPGGFEVLSGALRVGTAITSGWGAELEFVRSGESSRDMGPFYPLAAAAIQLFDPQLPDGSSPIAYRPEIRQRQTSFDIAAWARRAAGSNVDLIFLGGVALTRARTEITQSVAVARPTLVPFSSTYIEYATRPLVGMDVRIAMTSHLRLVSGIRVQGLTDGLIVRPSVALAWFF